MDVVSIIGLVGALVALTGILSAVAALLSSLGSSLSRRIGFKISGREVSIDLRHYEQSARELELSVRALQQHPRVLLSYAYADKAFAKKLAGDLESRGMEVWLPEERLRPGDDILSTIKHEMNDSQWVVNIISRKSLESKWVNKELHAALRSEAKRERPFVIPLLLEGTVPEPIADRLYADFRESYEFGLERLVASLKRGASGAQSASPEGPPSPA